MRKKMRRPNSIIIKRLPEGFTFGNNHFNDLYQRIQLEDTPETWKMLEGTEVKLNRRLFNYEKK